MADPTLQAPTSTTTAPEPPWTPVVVLKGALVAIDRTNSSTKTVVPFQFNPIELGRSLSPVYYQNRGDRYNATAKQSIDVKVTLDASEDGGPLGDDQVRLGILPQLAALELLINPSSTDLTTYLKKTPTTAITVLPPLAPRILFVWGPNRVLPVLITSLSVQEKHFNTSLNPIFAEVTLKLEVYPFDQAGADEYKYLQSNLTKLETLNQKNATGGVTIGVEPSTLT